jgi:nucleolar GTP-binding protein
MPTIPEPKTLINLLLSKLQKKTPTIVHKKFSIQKIRHFYIRKINFFYQEYEIFIEKIGKIFPTIDQLHPFFCDLFNILFNRDNYKLAFYQLYKSKKEISIIAKNYIKLLKYGKSLYNCKQIKKIALGKMCKKIQKIKRVLVFLEKIRLQIKIIPKIDPHKKIILLAGSSGVGKSSILNKFTSANVMVRENLYSTKSIFLGHLTFKFFRWQIIDTPGIRCIDFKFLNSIEMQSINAFINLDCVIIYFIDLNIKTFDQIEKQILIFNKLKKILRKKKKKILLSKTDLGWEKIINFQLKTIVTNLNAFDDNLEILLKNSAHDEIGLISVKEHTCVLKAKKKKNSKDFSFQTIERNTNKSQKIFGNSNKKPKKYNFSKEKESNKKVFSPYFRKIIMNNFSLYSNKKKSKKNNSINREEKFREYANEKNFASEKIQSINSLSKKYKNCKIYKKNFFSLKSAFLFDKK